MFGNVRKTGDARVAVKEFGERSGKLYLLWSQIVRCATNNSLVISY